MDVPEKKLKRYRYKDDAEAQACVEAASGAWWDAFMAGVPIYCHIPGTEKVLRIRPIRQS